MTTRIQSVSREKLREVIDSRAPLGLFICMIPEKTRHNVSKYVAVDNTTGDAWTEEFHKCENAMRWLMEAR